MERPTEYDPKAWEQWGMSPYLHEVRDALAALNGWEVEDIEAALRAIVDEHDVKPKEIFQPIRVALTGTTVSPGIFESLSALGRDEAVSRLENALHKAESEVT